MRGHERMIQVIRLVVSVASVIQDEGVYNNNDALHLKRYPKKMIAWTGSNQDDLYRLTKQAS